MIRIIVTGGNGFVGSHLVDELLKQNNEVTVIDNLSSSNFKNLEDAQKNKNFKFVKGDITDKNSLKEILTEDVDMIYHLSSVVGVKHYCKDPLKVFDVNVMGTRNILELALKNEIKVLFTSTSEIFGKNPKVPWSEDDDRVLGSTKVDRWSYSTSKAMCEHIIFGMNKNMGLPAVIVRFFNVYGPRQPPYFVISQSIYKILRNEKPLLYDSGNQTRCFTFVKDIIEGTLLAANNPRAVGEAINLGSNKESTIKEAIDKINNIIGDNKVGYEEFDTTKHYGDKYEDLSRRVPKVQKAKDVLGWEFKTSLRDGLTETIDWAKQNKWWLNLDD